MPLSGWDEISRGDSLIAIHETVERHAVPQVIEDLTGVYSRIEELNRNRPSDQGKSGSNAKVRRKNGKQTWYCHGGEPSDDNIPGTLRPPQTLAEQARSSKLQGNHEEAIIMC